MLLDAIRSGNLDQVRDLLAADASLSQTRTDQGASAVMWAVYTGHPELAPLLLGDRDPDIFEACALGRADTVAAELASDATLVNAPAPDGFTPLGLACFFRHPEVVELLLDRGADPSIPAANPTKYSPLHSAIASNSFEIVDLLLSRGADTNARDASGTTPLASANAHKNEKIIDRLVAAGATL
jgi:ankyrin repeat protein